MKCNRGAQMMESGKTPHRHLNWYLKGSGDLPALQKRQGIPTRGRQRERPQEYKRRGGSQQSPPPPPHDVPGDQGEETGEEGLGKGVGTRLCRSLHLLLQESSDRIGVLTRWMRWEGVTTAGPQLVFAFLHSLPCKISLNQVKMDRLWPLDSCHGLLDSRAARAKIFCAFSHSPLWTCAR